MKQNERLVFCQIRSIIQCLTVVILLLLCTKIVVFAQTAEQIAEKALAATVYLEMKDRNGAILGFGSGFFVQENLIATNLHVVQGAVSGTAKEVGNQYTKYVIEGITATDKTNDLALLKVVMFPNNPQLSEIHRKLLPSQLLPLGNSDNIKVGATVYVVGNPKGLEGTFSNGIISSRRDTDTKERLQMTAPVSPGSSGGPVLNDKGEVIGISYMTIEGGQNLNFAIPSNYLKTLIAQSGVVQPLTQENQSISADTYFLRGNTAYALELYKEAIVEYDKAIQLRPDYVKAYNNRGLAKMFLNQYFAAIADYDKTIQLNPNLAEAYNNRGIMKAKLERYFAAIADFDIAIELKPDLFNTYIARGNAKTNLQQPIAAIADYNTAIKIKPDYELAYYRRGLTNAILGQHFAAISDFDMAIRLKSDYADAYYMRGNIKAVLGQHNASIGDYNRAVQLNPDFADVYVSRGNAKATLKQYSAAISDYNKAIRLNPDDTEAYYSRGIAKVNLEQYSAAISDYNKVIRLNPDHVDAYYRRGAARADLRRYLVAIVDFDKTIQLEPNHVHAYLSRGFAYASLNLTSEAKQDFRIAVRLAELAGDETVKEIAEEALQTLIRYR